MSASTIHRPTENAAIGRVGPRILGAIERLWALLAHAVRCHDHCGANLLRCAIDRALAGGKVGAL
ncbi:hypothetical protein [Kitasatospora kifunensis]|uniref:Transposase n=1 Tax=Kitasatospora kifunensis TaxID=58351 RepID=A0A7W7QZ78_KITKI|nr:hypothetical protein [Kitasatospora kifunensis]MBB4922219.1 hypothetical protein [Kitasatospora kifunensis]